MAPEKVAQTEKAVAKAKAKRGEKTKFVEVNSLRAISLHSSDFLPVGSPQYTASPPRKPTDDPEQISLALAKPFSKLDSYRLDTRWTNTVGYFFGPADQDYINNTNGFGRPATCSTAGRGELQLFLWTQMFIFVRTSF